MTGDEQNKKEGSKGSDIPEASEHTDVAPEVLLKPRGAAALFEASARGRSLELGRRVQEKFSPEILARMDSMTRRAQEASGAAMTARTAESSMLPAIEALRRIEERQRQTAVGIAAHLAAKQQPALRAAAALSADMRRNTSVAQALLNAPAFRRLEFASRLVSIQPLMAYDDFIRDSDQNLQAIALAAHGHVVTGLIARDALLVEDADEQHAVIETVKAEIFVPWQDARAASGQVLYSRLDAVDPKLSELLQEGWHALGSPGPSWVTTACSAPLEALQRGLRALAPDEDVRAWASADGVASDDVEHNGRVKREARVRYLMRGRTGQRKLVEAEIDAVTSSVEQLVSRLNAGKHASAGDLNTVRSLLLSAEAILTGLLSPE